jgi:hypothetical protein
MMNRSLVASLGLACVLAACGDDTKPVGNQPDAGVMPDGGAPEVPLDRVHEGGSPTAIDIVGTRAFIGVGPRLTIWDLSAAPPTLIGESAPLRGVVNAVAAIGDRVYVAERLGFDSQIHVFDVTAPATPIETNVVSIAGSSGASVIRDLERAPDRLYVADQERGVIEVDLGNNADTPTAIRIAGPVGVTGLTLIGSRLYYTSESFFGGANVGALDLDDGLADLGSSFLGNHASVAFAAPELVVGAGPDGIYVYDLGDPSDPVELFHFGEHEQGPFARAIATHGTTAWVPAHDGLHILDLTTPSAIVHTGPLAVETTNVNATAATGEVLAVVTDRGRLLSFDTAGSPTQPAAPQIADVTLCADCVGISAVDVTVHLADIVGGLRIASLATLAARGRSAPLPVVPNTGGRQFVYEDVQVAGTYAYVADWMFGLRVFDVANVAAPTLVGSLATGGSPSGVAIAGDRAYVTEATGGGMLRVIDISDRAQPTELGSIPTSKAMAVKVRDSIAYVADESLFGTGGLRIFDVTTPSAIVPLAVYDTDCRFASDVALVGELAVVACAGDGFHWLDISNPAAPTRVAVTQRVGGFSSAMSVATWEGHAVLGHDRGITVMSAGAAPQMIATYPTASPVRALSVPSRGRIVAACGPGGVYQWQL